MSGKQHAKQQALRWKRKVINRIPGYTPEAETAEELNKKVRTLRKWRQLGIGPPWTRVGRDIHYNDESRAEWLRSQEVRPVQSETAVSRVRQDHAHDEAVA